MQTLFNYLLRIFLSLRLTVIGLGMLFILILWGTLYQVEYGLYLAQQRFFDSWIIWLFNFIPLPGAQLVMAALFINLICNMVLRFTYGWRQIGMVTIHMGLLLLLAGGWVTQRFGQEAFLTLQEGEISNLASSYRDWEIAAWRGTDGPEREIVAIDTATLKPGSTLPFDALGVQLVVDSWYPNSRAFASPDPALKARVINQSGITLVEGSPHHKDPQEDIPAGIFSVQMPETDGRKLILFGGEAETARMAVGDDTVYFSLRRKRIPLPMTVNLIKFTKEFHPNSQIPKSFSSVIEVDIHGVLREVLVEMNQPFRYQGYTFYQASYADLGQGAHLSTFAVTHNVGRLIPYIATGMTFLGLALHFLLELYRRREGVQR